MGYGKGRMWTSGTRLDVDSKAMVVSMIGPLLIDDTEEGCGRMLNSGSTREAELVVADSVSTNYQRTGGKVNAKRDVRLWKYGKQQRRGRGQQTQRGSSYLARTGNINSPEGNRSEGIATGRLVTTTVATLATNEVDLTVSDEAPAFNDVSTPNFAVEAPGVRVTYTVSVLTTVGTAAIGVARIVLVVVGIGFELAL
jgi:hypothetical protein